MGLILNVDNMPAASVVIEADSPPAVSFAARELSRYLAILTGGRFPVCEGTEPSGGAVLRLLAPLPPAPSPCGRGGDRPTAGRGTGPRPTERGAYSWRVHEGGIEILGERPGAVLHAVYALLEQMGCRWLHPRDGGEIIPRTPQIELPFGEHVAEPVMAIRELTNLYEIDREYPLHIDWMAKNRFNRFMAFLNVEGSLEAFTELEPELVVRDMDATLGHHSFRFLLPPEEYFDEHPEWYALIGGERSPDGQLCTSNPEVVERVAGRICELFGAHPTVEMFGLWPNDGFGWCECEACLALEEQRPSRFWPAVDTARRGDARGALSLRPAEPRRTETYLRFVNAVAALVAEGHPARRLSALAYVNYADAPERVRPAENVAICFAPFQRCLKHSLCPEVDCERANAAYAREFERWREVTAGDLYVFSYLMQIHTLSLPYPIHGVIQENWQWLLGARCDGFTMEFAPLEWGALGANAYLMARLAWEPQMDVRAWLAEHDEAIYGPAAERMGEWRRELAEVLVAGGRCTGHYCLTWTVRATERMLRPALEALGHARALAATGGKRHWRAVEQAWVGMELLLRVGEWQRLLRDAAEAPEARRESLQRRADGAKAAVLDFAREHAESGAVDVRRYERLLSFC